MSEDEDPRKTALGENLAQEWKADSWAGSLWDAIELGQTNPNAALEKMQDLASKNSPLSMFYLGEYYIYGRHGVERDSAKAEHWLREAASKGSIEGSWLLARHLEGAKNYEEAEDEYKKLEELGYSPALYALGFEYNRGIWLKRDVKKAIEYLEKAEQLGHLWSAHLLWHILRKEKMGLTNWIKGWIKWFRMLIPFVRCHVNYPNSDRLRR